jgi:hypothetical protein
MSSALHEFVEISRIPLAKKHSQENSPSRLPGHLFVHGVDIDRPSTERGRLGKGGPWTGTYTHWGRV